MECECETPCPLVECTSECHEGSLEVPACCTCSPGGEVVCDDCWMLEAIDS